MSSFSIVIVCKNEAHVIENTLKNLEGVSDDIVVYDNGSTDGTLEIAGKFKVRLIQGSWEGYGTTKRKAALLAKNEWVFSIDADETMDDQLKGALKNIELNNDAIVFEISFRNFLGNKYLKYGEWGGDRHIRFFNKRKVNWNDAPVHEQLVLPGNTSIKKLKGHILHHTMKDMKDYASKMVKYAMLNAEKYHQQGRRASWFKIRMAPGIAFFQYYILRLGFLDGHEGYMCAKMTAYYTFLKYARLRELAKNRNNN
jgi:glycosyltransferase involved in cell wall biosynthesis